MICPKCQSTLNDDALVCGYCGTQLSGARQQLAPRPVSTQQTAYPQPMPMRSAYTPAPAPRPAAPAQTNGMAVGALVCGVLCFMLPGILVEILGIIFGVMGKNRADEIGSGAEVATTGLTLCIISLVCALLLWIAVGIVVFGIGFDVFDVFEDLFDEIGYYL